jgi:hypothetical protein
MKILADNFRNRATAGQPFILTADPLSGPRTANSRPVAIFSQTVEKRRQTVEAFYQAAEGVHIYGMRDGETVFSYLASETHAAVDVAELLRK